MPKGYLVANIRVQDQERFQSFSGMAGPIIKKYGGTVLARGPMAERLEGRVTGIVMMIEFESKEAAHKSARTSAASFLADGASAGGGRPSYWQ